VHVRRLGSQGLEVAAIGLGGRSMSQSSGPADDEESIATSYESLDSGVTFFDPADMYGPFTNERLVGRTIAGRRHEVTPARGPGQHRGRPQVRRRPGALPGRAEVAGQHVRPSR